MHLRHGKLARIASQLRANMEKHFDQVESGRLELVVTRENHEPVVIMLLAELEGLRETLHLLSTAANADHLLRSIAELDASRDRDR